MLDAAPRQDVAAELGPIPNGLDCIAELHASSGEGNDLGFVDLCFSGRGEGFTLFAELKLHAGYGGLQLERYLSALGGLDDERCGLIAVTRNLPSVGEQAVAHHPRWVGSVRWHAIFARLIALQHRDPVMTEMWRALLTLVRDQGDFGVMNVDPKAVEGWARFKEGREILTHLLEEIHAPTLDCLRRSLAEHQSVDLDADLATEIRHKGKRLVWPWGENLHIKYAIPAGDNERLRVQFVGGGAEPLFTVEARHGDDHVLRAGSPALLGVTRDLKAKGFEPGHHWGSYWSRPHPANEWLYEGDAISEKLRKLAEQDIRDLVGSGIFEALPPDEPNDGSVRNDAAADI